MDSEKQQSILNCVTGYFHVSVIGENRIPIIHCPDCGNVPVPEEELPLTLPDVESYEPTGTGESPLAGIEEWVNCTCPVCGKPAKRETNTMPQWAGSSWYFLRYVDSKTIKN